MNINEIVQESNPNYSFVLTSLFGSWQRTKGWMPLADVHSRTITATINMCILFAIKVNTILTWYDVVQYGFLQLHCCLR